MKLSKKAVFFAALALLIVVEVAASLLTSGGGSYTVNPADGETGLPVPAGMRLFSAPEAGFGFLYPEDLDAAWTDGDGAYIYCGGQKAAPYILVYRTDGRGMTPEQYFKSVDALVLDSFDEVASTSIQETEVGGKTLYLTRYECTGGGQSYVIDRYLEPYDSCCVEYTAVSDAAGSLNTPLYHAISTLRLQEGAYDDSFSG